MLNITPAMHVKNEEYWIHYVLRDLLRVFDRVVMLDTGSTDRTVDIAKATVGMVGGNLHLMLEDMGNDRHRIGNAPNMLIESVDTEWMLLVDGDEIWQESQLRALQEIEPAGNWLVGMCNGRNVIHTGTVIREREGFSADRLFHRTVRWNVRTDYPFQSHGLDDKCKHGQVFHTDFQKSYFWHVRHLQRSSKDADASYRIVKKNYFPDKGTYYNDIPADWIGEITTAFPNPYLG